MGRGLADGRIAPIRRMIWQVFVKSVRIRAGWGVHLGKPRVTLVVRVLQILHSSSRDNGRHFVFPLFSALPFPPQPALPRIYRRTHAKPDVRRKRQIYLENMLWHMMRHALLWHTARCKTSCRSPAEFITFICVLRIAMRARASCETSRPVLAASRSRAMASISSSLASDSSLQNTRGENKHGKKNKQQQKLSGASLPCSTTLMLMQDTNHKTQNIEHHKFQERKKDKNYTQSSKYCKNKKIQHNFFSINNV